MKFIDEFDLEVVNQALNFETSDCSITGGCDIFTTKPVASDKKLYKTIDRHLDSLLQENELFNAAIKRRCSVGEKNTGLDDNISDENSPSSFWEQKRRMSVSEATNGTGSSSPICRSNKLNDQNLKEFVQSTSNNKNTNGYMSSSSMESCSKSESARPSVLRRTSSVGSFPGSNSGSGKKLNCTEVSTNETNTLSQRRKSSTLSFEKVNIGPFGPINETASRRAFAYLIAILNASYPDHDFSSLQPTDFVKCSRKSFISKFENTLISLGKPPQEWIWETINSHMDINDCAFYQYVPNKSFLDDEPGYLWSMMWFLFNKKRKRVAYVYLSAFRLKGSPAFRNTISTNEQYAEMVSLKGEFTRTRKLTLDHDNDMEGEYDLTYDENAILDEEEDESNNAMEEDFDKGTANTTPL